MQQMESWQPCFNVNRLEIDWTGSPMVEGKKCGHKSEAGTYTILMGRSIAEGIFVLYSLSVNIVR